MEDQPIATSEAVEPMSFSDKLMNVFASPGTLFEYVASSGKETSNWAVPLVLSMIVGVIFTFVVFTQPPIQDQMQVTQQKTMEKMVASGKLTQEQADAAAENNFAKPGSPLFLIFGSVGVVLVTAATLFLAALAYWLIVKVGFKSAIPYMKVTEVVGLSMYISALGTLFSMILIVAMGSIHATTSLALFVSNFDQGNTIDKLLAAVNIMTFWSMGVSAIGLAKVCKVDLAKAAGVVIAVWIIWTAITLQLNIGG
jgi:Yip1 domain